MGCLLCNITSCEEFVQGPKRPIQNPFYRKSEEELDQFLDELAYDIASRHPELVEKINSYAKKLKETGLIKND